MAEDRSLIADVLLLVGLPALVYGGLIALGVWVVGRRIGRRTALAVGVPVLLGIALNALALGLFAGIGAEIVAGREVPVEDGLVGWGRLVLVGLYALAICGSALVGRRIASRVGINRARATAAIAAATFFFVIISAPFSSIVNACHVGHAVLVAADVQCNR